MADPQATPPEKPFKNLLENQESLGWPTSCTEPEVRPPVATKVRPDLKPKLRELPHKPGVCVMRDRFSRVIYVEKAKDLKRQVSQYFMLSKWMTADLKTRALLEAIWDLEWHMVHTVPEALLMEGKLIKDFRPRCNISFRDDKPFLLVKVDPREEWPRFRLTRIRSGDGSQYSRPATIPRARSAETGRKAISTRLDALRG